LETESLMNEQSGYWDNISKNWQQKERPSLWRLFSDRLNTKLFCRWMSNVPVERILKTDMFDESLTDGLYPLLSSRAKYVIGMDVSAEVVKTAQGNHHGLQTLVADVRRLPFADGTIDTIVSNSTLDHFRSYDDIHASLTELGRVLKSGGQLMLTMDNKANPIIALRNILPFRLLNHIGVLPFYVGATFGPGSLRKALEKINIDVMEVTAIWHFPRVVTVTAGNIFSRFTSIKTQQKFLRFLLKFESLSRLPTRFFTGYFVAANAFKRSQTAYRTQESNIDLQVTEFKADTIQHLPRASEYVKALTQQGPSIYIENAHVEMSAVILDDIVLPIVISAPRDGNADTCSAYSHYVQYTLEELIKRNKKIPRWLFNVVLGSFGSILKICDIDKVVYLNNYLFATNPHQLLSSQQIRGITAYLLKRYPKHTIVHPTINPYLHQSYFNTLQDNGYMMIKSRKIHLLDPASERFQNRTNAKLDLDLLKRTSYDIISADAISDSDCARMAELYRSLYLDKHSYLNPQLNKKFFLLTVRKNILVYRAFKKNGKIDAFVSYFVRDGVLTGAFVGYDRSLLSKLGLYRQVIAILIRDAQKLGLILNLSSGSGKFKELRGAFPVVEYHAVYNRHLSLRRRFPWFLIQKEGEAWSLGL